MAPDDYRNENNFLSMRFVKNKSSSSDFSLLWLCSPAKWQAAKISFENVLYDIAHYGFSGTSVVFTLCVLRKEN